MTNLASISCKIPVATKAKLEEVCKENNTTVYQFLQNQIISAIASQDKSFFVPRIETVFAQAILDVHSDRLMASTKDKLRKLAQK